MTVVPLPLGERPYGHEHPWPDTATRRLAAAPGSLDAHQRGCTCPVIDNAYGAGQAGHYRISEFCPLHGRGNWK